MDHVATELMEIIGDCFDDTFEFELNCLYLDCTFDAVDINDRFDNCKFQDCTFSYCAFDDLTINDRFEDCEFIDCEFTDCTVRSESCTISECTFNGGGIGNGAFAEGNILDCAFDRTVFFVERVDEVRFCSFMNCDLSRLILKTVCGCKFIGCDLGVFTGISSDACTFDDCKATAVSFDELTDTKILNCSWPDIFTAATVRESVIEDSIITGAKFRHGEIEDLCLTRCDLARAEFVSEGVDFVSILNCNTVGCTFTDCRITDCTIEVDRCDEEYNEGYSSKEMVFSQSSIATLEVVDTDIQLTTFSLCKFDASQCRSSNLGGVVFLDSEGEFELDDCHTIGMKMDEHSYDSIEIFQDTIVEVAS